MSIKIKPIPFTAEELRTLLDYCPENGKLTWKVKASSNTIIGKEAGYLNNQGYRQIGIKGVDYLAHRLVWLHHYGSEPSNFLDHINNVRNDNRIENLRKASNAENCRNRGKDTDNTSGYKGVSFHKQAKKFRAYCKANGKNHHLGLYDTAEAAHEAYVAFATKAHGDFARVA